MTLQYCGVSGSNLGSITPALLEIASTQMEVNNNYNEIAMDSTELQQKFNEAQTSETREEGKKGADICYTQAAGSFGSAFADGLTTAATSISTKSLNQQLTTQNNELNELENVQKQIQEKPPCDINLAEENGAAVNDPITKRRQELAQGTILNTKENNGKALNLDAINGAPDDMAAQMKEQTETQIKNKTTSINTLQNQISSKENFVRMLGDMGKQVFNSCSQFAQGLYTAQKSQAQAAGLSDQFDQQIQATAAQTDQKAVGDGIQQVFSVFQALAQAGQALV